MKKDENVKNEETNVQETETINAEEVIVANNDCWWKKAIKIAVGGLALIATGVVGYLLGRNSEDDESEEETEDESKAA